MNSPIEVSLGSRQGVCQDFSHIMIAVVRSLGIPCRYVSGYLYHDELHHDRSAEGATHAWVEALLPGSGLGRVRSDQRRDRRQPAHPHRRRPRLRRRAADDRHDEGARRNRAAGPRPRRRRRRRCCRQTRSSPPTRSGRCFSKTIRRRSRSTISNSSRPGARERASPHRHQSGQECPSDPQVRSREGVACQFSVHDAARVPYAIGLASEVSVRMRSLQVER